MTHEITGNVLNEDCKTFNCFHCTKCKRHTTNVKSVHFSIKAHLLYYKLSFLNVRYWNMFLYMADTLDKHVNDVLTKMPTSIWELWPTLISRSPCPQLMRKTQIFCTNIGCPFESQQIPLNELFLSMESELILSIAWPRSSELFWAVWEHPESRRGSAEKCLARNPHYTESD